MLAEPEEDIFDGFVGRLVERAKELTPGDPAEADDVGGHQPLAKLEQI